MFQRIRYFVEDLSATAIAAIAAVLGLALGAMVTTQLTAGTPYSRTDLDRVAVDTVPPPAPVVVEPDTSELDAEVARLEEKVKDLRALLVTERGTSGDLQTEVDELTVKLERIIATRIRLKDDLKAAAEAPTTSTVSGALVTTSVLLAEEKPWPATCAGVAPTFQVRVSTGGATVFIAEPSSGEVTRRDVEDDTLTIGCRFTYQATLPMPLAKSYDFEAVATLAPGTGLDSGTAGTEQLEKGDAPQLTATS